MSGVAPACSPSERLERLGLTPFADVGFVLRLVSLGSAVAPRWWPSWGYLSRLGSNAASARLSSAKLSTLVQLVFEPKVAHRGLRTGIIVRGNRSRALPLVGLTRRWCGWGRAGWACGCTSDSVIGWGWDLHGAPRATWMMIGQAVARDAA